ncbi:hypothetical protein JW710_02770 [Candidatus Dojkabacteria bacterium]|nr:hypothetical protein [Candidatus Dojkabacteria bacterium]
MAVKDFDYEMYDEVIRMYLEGKGYSVDALVGNASLNKFTYSCEKEGMPFVAKMGVALEGDDTRVKDLRNEVEAVKRLWELYPDGEAKSFLLPPGAEEVFDEKYGKIDIYGYSRFWLEGLCLGDDIRMGVQHISDWIEKFNDIISEIDSFPKMDLPKTKEKEGTDINGKILDTAKNYFEKLQSLAKAGKTSLDMSVLKGFQAKYKESVEFFKKKKLVLGTVHGNLAPDNFVYENGKPYLISFTKLCQCYPRLYDVPWVYSWICVVTGDADTAQKFWDLSTGKLDKEMVDYLEKTGNLLLLGMLWEYLARENNDLKVTNEMFFD